MTFIAKLNGKATGIKVGTAFAVFVNQTVIGKLRPFLFIQLRQFAEGQEVQSDLRERITTFSLPRPATRPVIAIAGGAKKAAGVLAALRGGWLTGLVTDEHCARHALEA